MNVGMKEPSTNKNPIMKWVHPRALWKTMYLFCPFFAFYA